MTQFVATLARQGAEARVQEVLQGIPAPWKIFPAVEYRLPNRGGESIGEADLVVFHPQSDMAIFEIKAGAVEMAQRPVVLRFRPRYKAVPFFVCTLKSLCLAPNNPDEPNGRAILVLL